MKKYIWAWCLLNTVLIALILIAINILGDINDAVVKTNENQEVRLDKLEYRINYIEKRDTTIIIIKN